MFTLASILILAIVTIVTIIILYGDRSEIRALRFQLKLRQEFIDRNLLVMHPGLFDDGYVFQFIPGTLRQKVVWFNPDCTAVTIKDRTKAEKIINNEHRVEMEELDRMGM